MAEDKPKNTLFAFADAVMSTLDAPVTWFRGDIKDILIMKFFFDMLFNISFSLHHNYLF